MPTLNCLGISQENNRAFIFTVRGHWCGTPFGGGHKVLLFLWTYFATPLLEFCTLSIKHLRLQTGFNHRR